MSGSTWNGVTIPVGGDAWNLINDTVRGFNTSGLIIPVTSQAQRDGLAALAPGGVLPLGATVIRNDLTGAPFEKWDGTIWRRSGSQTWQFDRTTSTDSTFTTANTNLVSGTITAAPAGNYLVNAICALYASTGAVVGYVYPKAGSTQTNRRWDLTDTSHPVSAQAPMAYTHAGGDLTVSAGYSVTSGSAVVTGTGGGLTSVIVTFLGN